LAGTAGDMTAKVRLLLRRHGLAADAIPRSGPRLLASDIEAYVAARPGGVAVSAPRQPVQLPALAAIEPLTPAARGMLATVTWQRDHAATAYLEIDYDPRPWETAATAFMRQHRLLFSPLLSLMAHRLAQLAPGLGANATVLEDGEARLVRYHKVNLGFTVQAGEVLYFCVVEAADAMEPAQFVARLFDLQRRAMGHKLTPAEMSGATIGFTSMARWGVQRHQPVLAPNTAVMIAHAAAAPGGERAVLGITYDHRLLSGFDAVRLLKKLVQPDNYGA
jgi:pyruvate dehydrogenase E2 component (dihydrolipoamide acetyltransferase)